MLPALAGRAREPSPWEGRGAGVPWREHDRNSIISTHVARRNGLAPGEQVTVSLLSEGIHLMPWVKDTHSINYPVNLRQIASG